MDGGESRETPSGPQLLSQAGQKLTSRWNSGFRCDLRLKWKSGVDA